MSTLQRKSTPTLIADAGVVDAEIASDYRREDGLGLRFGRELSTHWALAFQVAVEVRVEAECKPGT